MTKSTPQHLTINEGVLFVALELSASSWKLGFSDNIGRKARVRSIPAGDFDGLKKEIDVARQTFKLENDSKVVTCYEAGRDGFWIHRALVVMGFTSFIVEPASIQVNRKQKRAKTDRLDVQMIVNALIRHYSGDQYACRMNRIPSIADEDARHLNREMRTIKTERTAHTNRIKSLLAVHGITVSTINRNFVSSLESLTTGDNNPLPPQLKQRLEREFERLQLANEQVRTLQMEVAKIIRTAAKLAEANATPDDNYSKISNLLNELNGIGPVTSITLATEVFAWRDIKNRRQLGALAGLTPTPFASGSEEREQGISKSGRPEIRTLMIEIAWGWLTFQPTSGLSKWYREKFEGGTKRNRKVGIVALARKLLVALGKYIRTGELPEGAKLSEELKFNYSPSLFG